MIARATAASSVFLVIALCVAIFGYSYADDVVYGRVRTVRDGDTVEMVMTTGETLVVRLAGIDAPESRQPWGMESGSALREIAEQALLLIEIDSTDRYGRTIAWLYPADGDAQSLNYRMVEEGWAWWYESYASDRTDLRDAQVRARRSERGLWQDAEPIPPWAWRRGTRHAPEESPVSESFVDRDCSDFPSWDAAQRFFLEAGGPERDPHRLDANGDGIACESIR